MRTLITLLLLLTIPIFVQSQKSGRWASARERGLKGRVHTVISKCSNINGNYEARYKYEFARDGELLIIESPQSNLPVVRNPLSYKVTGRNSQGDIGEVSYFLEGGIIEKERYEYEYDSLGNWIKQVTSIMRTYGMEGGNWKAGEWQTKYVCNRMIEYHP
jgi:hypothetical protein